MSWVLAPCRRDPTDSVSSPSSMYLPNSGSSSKPATVLALFLCLLGVLTSLRKPGHLRLAPYHVNGALDRDWL